MSRFALFAAALIVIVAIGAQTSQGSAAIKHGNASIKSMCVCVPTRAGLMIKSAIAKTQTQYAALSKARAAVTQ